MSSADVPQIMNYEGTLTDTSGKIVPDGTYEIQFSIYDTPIGGTALWTEKWGVATAPVVTSKGSFNAMLGTHNPIPADFFDKNPVTYLGAKVGSDVEMMPRQRLGSVAYALAAGSGGIPKGGASLELLQNSKKASIPPSSASIMLPSGGNSAIRIRHS